MHTLLTLGINASDVDDLEVRPSMDGGVELHTADCFVGITFHGRDAAERIYAAIGAVLAATADDDLDDADDTDLMDAPWWLVNETFHRDGSSIVGMDSAEGYATEDRAVYERTCRNRDLHVRGSERRWRVIRNPFDVMDGEDRDREHATDGLGDVLLAEQANRGAA